MLRHAAVRLRNRIDVLTNDAEERGEVTPFRIKMSSEGRAAGYFDAHQDLQEEFNLLKDKQKNEYLRIIYFFLIIAKP
jgi:hypothetical protein